MKIHDCKQGTEAWERLRAGKITASCFSDIFTASTVVASKSQDPYINKLLAGLCCPEWKSFNGNFATERGTELEPMAREAFTEHTGLEVTQVGFITMNDPGEPHSKAIGCSPDGLLGEGEPWAGGLELKCPFPETQVAYLRAAAKARSAISGGRNVEDLSPALQAHVLSLGVPDTYKQQVHGSLIVTGLPEWHFWSYFPGMRPLHCIVRPDDYTAKLRAAVLQFAELYSLVIAEASPYLVP